jgi:hypothetical protein
MSIGHYIEQLFPIIAIISAKNTRKPIPIPSYSARVR